MKTLRGTVKIYVRTDSPLDTGRLPDLLQGENIIILLPYDVCYALDLMPEVAVEASLGFDVDWEERVR